MALKDVFAFELGTWGFFFGLLVLVFFFLSCYIQIGGDLLTDGTWLLRSNSRPKGDERPLSWCWPCSCPARADCFGFLWVVGDRLRSLLTRSCTVMTWIRKSLAIIAVLFYIYIFPRSSFLSLFVPRFSLFLGRIHFLFWWGFYIEEWLVHAYLSAAK